MAGNGKKLNRANRKKIKIQPTAKSVMKAIPFYHTVRVFLIDREDRIRKIYSSGTLDPRLVLADVKTLLLEEARISKQ